MSIIISIMFSLLLLCMYMFIRNYQVYCLQSKMLEEVSFLAKQAIEARTGDWHKPFELLDVPFFKYDSMMWHLWVPISYYKEQWGKMLDKDLNERFQAFRKEYHERRKSCT